MRWCAVQKYPRCEDKRGMGGRERRAGGGKGVVNPNEEEEGIREGEKGKKKREANCGARNKKKGKEPK